MSEIIFEITYKIVGILASLTVVITFISQIIIPNKKRQLSDHQKFTDRKKQLNLLVTTIVNGSRIINVYGKKGIGKSYFLKYFSDLVNKKISKKEITSSKYYELKNIRKQIKKSYVIYYELNEYTKESEIISDFTSTFANRFSKNPYKSFKNIIRNLFYYKKIIIIFDNITNECLENAVESIINSLLPYSKKLVFVVGSIDYLTFPKLNGSKIKIQVDEFGKSEIEEYSINCGNQLTEDNLNSIINVSNGLPILVDLMISNKSYNVFNEVLEKYIENLFNQIKLSDQYLAKILITLSLLSLVNSNVSLSLLNSISDEILVNRQSVQKLNMLSVIKYNEKEDSIKVHDIIRDYLVYEYAQRDYYDLIEQLVNYYIQKKDYDSCSVYSVLLNRKSYDKCKSIIKKCVEKAMETENYSYLLALGNHYFKSIVPEDNSMFYLISYGYISALLSVGDYPSAKKFCDEKKLALTVAVDENQMDLALQIANLYHLQSNYLLAIDSYNILLGLNNKSIKNNEYASNCYLKIAHAYRHMAEYDEAQKYYFLAIENTRNKAVIITAYLELSVIYLFNNKLLNDNPYFDNLDELFDRAEKLLKEDNNHSLYLLYLRNYARYLISIDDNSQFIDTIFNCLNKALKGYEQLKKRLIYTMNFEFGEYYRRLCDNEKSIEYYNISLFFSYRNGDKNLETMSYIGIILSELQCGIHYFTKSKKEQIELLVKCIELSDKHHLKMNSILSHILLKYINTNSFSDNEYQLLSQINLKKVAMILKNRDNKALNTVQLFMM